LAEYFVVIIILDISLTATQYELLYLMISAWVCVQSELIECNRWHLRCHSYDIDLWVVYSSLLVELLRRFWLSSYYTLLSYKGVCRKA